MTLDQIEDQISLLKLELNNLEEAKFNLGFKDYTGKYLRILQYNNDESYIKVEEQHRNIVEGIGFSSLEDTVYFGDSSIFLSNTDRIIELTKDEFEYNCSIFISKAKSLVYDRI